MTVNARVYLFLKRHSAVLQAVAALSVVVGIIWSIISHVVPKFFTTDLVVTTNLDSEAFPPDILEWTQAASQGLMRFGKQPKEAEVEETLQVISKSKLTADLAGWGGLDFGRATIDLYNNSDGPISAVRVRLDNIGDLWSVSLNGSFLTEQESTRFKTLTEGLRISRRRTVVLPDLPTLPPRSALRLEVITANTGFVQVAIAANGLSVAQRRMVSTEETGLLRFSSGPVIIFGYFH
ncbi:MAG TPA: hypothetical protein VN851_06625 [Thermoanaerobaculia bacterium]|nr:hypothetical protein [Thermoanaerobaculia bacterium]